MTVGFVHVDVKESLRTHPICWTQTLPENETGSLILRAISKNRNNTIRLANTTFLKTRRNDLMHNVLFQAVGDMVTTFTARIATAGI